MYHHSIQTGPQNLRTGWKAILFAGLVAGVADGLAAVISVYLTNGRGPDVVFKFVASGIFGSKEAFAGGLPMVFAGIFFHMIIATIWAAIFFYIYPLLKNLGKQRVLVGLAYGVIVWLGMNLIVVPLSNTPKMPGTVVGVIKGMLILMFCIGLPISFIVSKYYSERKAE